MSLRDINKLLDSDVNIEFGEIETSFAPPEAIRRSFSSHLLFNTAMETNGTIRLGTATPTTEPTTPVMSASNTPCSSRYSSTSSIFLAINNENQDIENFRHNNFAQDSTELVRNSAKKSCDKTDYFFSQHSGRITKPQHQGDSIYATFPRKKRNQGGKSANLASASTTLKSPGVSNDEYLSTTQDDSTAYNSPGTMSRSWWSYQDDYDKGGNKTHRADFKFSNSNVSSAVAEENSNLARSHQYDYNAATLPRRRKTATAAICPAVVQPAATAQKDCWPKRMDSFYDYACRKRRGASQSSAGEAGNLSSASSLRKLINVFSNAERNPGLIGISASMRDRC